MEIAENINLHMREIEDHFKAAISVDCVIFGYDESELKVLTLDCNMEPYLGFPSLLGDLVKNDENLDEAATRILFERTGITDVFLEQVKAFGETDRHPMGRVLTVAYYALIKVEDYRQNGQPRGIGAKWRSISQLNEMAFDHKNILDSSLHLLRKRLIEYPLWMKLLPKHFSLPELQNLFEAVLAKSIDKRNFRKKISKLGIIKEVGKKQEDVPHRPAKLYAVNEKKLREDYSFLLKNPFIS
ncbi:MAG: NUDIX domain-containing protein [Saprospirales bacterium]|nr:MAG: NUDIX domain-containing protein [Saprospirales bacterium]